MASWPRPERLLPPRIVEALAAAQSGDAARALELVAASDAGDPLVGDAVRLVRAWTALERGEKARARRELRAVALDTDPGLALLATEALVDDLVAERRFAAVPALLRRARARGAAARLWAEATALSVQLARLGALPASAVTSLAGRLDREHPPLVHALVHVLRSERALLAGELGQAVDAHREARPYVRASRDASVSRRHESVGSLLRAPFAEVEDWEEPLRPVSREELAALATKPWQLWIDALHHRALRRGRGRRGVADSLAIDAQGASWDTLLALMRSPHRRLSWAQASTQLGSSDLSARGVRLERVARDLRAAGIPLGIDADGYRLGPCRFVLLVPAAALPGVELRILARLAETPGARAAQMEGPGQARRSVQRHLARLRRLGYVRMVGGGNEARYYLI